MPRPKATVIAVINNHPVVTFCVVVMVCNTLIALFR